ncbi:MAG: FG-GAP-like repeat-containing protein [Bacteroidota bacterium]
MRRNCLVPLLIIFSVVKLQAQTHVISSFSPASGPIGTTVVINGSGFSAIADSNTVFFGSLKATINSASTNALIVKVPAKATYNNIRVNTKRGVILGGSPVTKWFTTESHLPFDVTFEDDGIITPNSFNIESIISNANIGGYNIYIGDFDGDEKTDIASNRSVYRNTTQDTPSIAASVSVPGSVSGYPGDSYPYSPQTGFFASTDMNGDAMPELFVMARNLGSDAGLWYQNTSTPGNISFSNYFYSLGPIVFEAICSDVNNDGKPDIVYSGYGMNISEGIFGPGLSDEGIYHIPVCADFDGDGNMDIVASHNWDINGYEPDLYFFRNNGAASNYVFQDFYNISGIEFIPPTGERPNSIVAGDLNGDGKADLAIGINGRNIHVLISNSTGGSLSFLPAIQLSAGGSVTAINDIDGDGKPDIIGAGYIYKNTSSGNNISFASGIACPKGIIGDFDADGKQDFLVSAAGKTSVFRHNPISNRKLCNGANVSLTTPVNGSAFQWQLNPGSGFANITDNAVYSGTNTAVLQVSNIPSSAYGYEYRCLVDNNPCGQFKVTFENKWLGTTDNAWETPANWSCGTIPDVNTDVVITSGTVAVNTSTTIRSLTVSPSANFTVAPGVILTITH